MVRQLQPWHENIKKRQVKSPKVYLRDSGLLHSLLNIHGISDLYGHPKAGASWEGFAIEQFLNVVNPSAAFFWATHSGAKIDLFFIHKGRRYGAEVKFSEAPGVTKSIRIARKELDLEHVWILYPGETAYPADEAVTVWPLRDIVKLGSHLNS